ncbi:hypothetical protein GBA52_002850 [Prunus armeniaca]|nr:hypothetical protein GBA52_002850 [Prunus armeniaca]
MVQGLSLNTLTTSRNGAFCGSMPSWRKHFKLTRKTQISSVIERHGIWHLCHQSLVLRGNPNMLKQRNVRVEAGWLFKRGDQGLNASSEQSEAANEDILIFFFQLDLATRVQYALNTEQYDIAQQLRNKLTEVEAEVIRQQEAKRGSSPKSEAQDKAISIIRLRADLQKAIESENYALAAKLRDAISELEAESLAASAKALAHENANYSFRLGQRVEKLHRGSNQPFYQVLVDVHADPNLLVAYVSEENLLAPDEPDVMRGMEVMLRCLDKSKQQTLYKILTINIFFSSFSPYIENSFPTSLHKDPQASTKLIESYAQMGSLRSSTQVFETFPKPDAFMWGVLMKCLVWNHYFQEAISLYHKMLHHVTSMNRFIFPSILRACSGYGDLGVGGKVHGRIIKCGFDSDVVIETSLLGLYGELRCLDNARKVFYAMPMRDVVSWSSIISCLVENGEASEGLEMFRWMVSEGVESDSVTMLGVAEACGELALLRVARSVHGHVVRRGIKSDGALENSLISMYSKCGDLQSVQRIFRTVTHWHTASWTAMISSYNQAGYFLEALDAFVEMQESKVEPNSVTLMNALRSCIRLDLHKEGRSVHCFAIRNVLDPDLDFLGSALFELYSEIGGLSYCQKLLNTIGERNVVLWNTIISGYCQKGLLREALLIFVQMPTQGLMPDSFSMSSALSACGKVGLVELGHQIHGHIIKRGYLDEFVLNSLIDMYSKCGFVDSAYMIFDKIQHLGVITWNSMISGFSQNGDPVMAISLFDKMFLNCLEINEVAILSVIQACSELGYLEKGKWVHHKLITYGDLQFSGEFSESHSRTRDNVEFDMF